MCALCVFYIFSLDLLYLGVENEVNVGILDALGIPEDLLKIGEG